MRGLPVVLSEFFVGSFCEQRNFGTGLQHVCGKDNDQNDGDDIKNDFNGMHDRHSFSLLLVVPS
jgi:hypothetical protein